MVVEWGPRTGHRTQSVTSPVPSTEGNHCLCPLAMLLLVQVRLSAPSYRGDTLHFFLWVPSKDFCSARLVCPSISSFSTGGQPAPMSLRFPSWKTSSFPEPLCYSGLPPKGLSIRLLNRPKSALQVQGDSFDKLPPYFSKNWKLCLFHDHFLQDGLQCNHHPPALLCS